MAVAQNLFKGTEKLKGVIAMKIYFVSSCEVDLVFLFFIAPPFLKHTSLSFGSNSQTFQCYLKWSRGTVGNQNF